MYRSDVREPYTAEEGRMGHSQRATIHRSFIVQSSALSRLNGSVGGKAQLQSYSCLTGPVRYVENSAMKTVQVALALATLASPMNNMNVNDSDIL